VEQNLNRPNPRHPGPSPHAERGCSRAQPFSIGQSRKHPTLAGEGTLTQACRFGLFAAGRMKQAHPFSRRVFAPEACPAIPKPSSGRDLVGRRRWWDRCRRDRARKVATKERKNRKEKGKRNAERRVAVFSLRATPRDVAIAKRFGRGSPFGVPPRHLRQRPNAAAQLQPRASWDGRLRSGRYPPPAVPVQRSSSQTGRNAGRACLPKPPGSEADEAPPAGTARAPTRRRPRRASLMGAIREVSYPN
jgi:hypothetical protein